MGWSYSFWKENFYPPQTNPEDFLREYSKHFNTVEVNSTFYRIPKISIIKNWLNQTKSDFIFSMKAPKKITHGQYPDEKSEYLDFFFNTIINLGKKLGPIIFQFPEYFKSTKSIVFDQRANVEEIDKLMASFSNWEKERVNKKEEGN